MQIIPTKVRLFYENFYKKSEKIKLKTIVCAKKKQCIM